MQKRNNPLETKEVLKESTLSKRVNPLSLNASEKVEVKEGKKKEEPMYIINESSLVKRKIFISTLSKDILKVAQEIYPDTKMKIVIENALLEHISYVDNEKYEVLTEALAKRG